MSKRIYLSPSNQKDNTYKTGGTNEMAQCDKIAQAAYKALTRCGFSVKVGKSGDSMANRCNESDAFKADIHLPIHTNAFDAKTTGGTLVMLYKSSTEHNKAGKALLNAVGKISPGPDYALRYRSDLYELNVPNAMSLYLEVEFHDTKTGSDWIRNNIVAIGEAIAKGLCDYFDVEYKSDVEEESASLKTETYDIKMLRIYKGSPDNTEGQVLTLQRILNELKNGSGYRGIDGKKLALDGVFGDNTEHALKEYQKVHSLKQDGVCDKSDWSKLLCEYKK